MQRKSYQSNEMAGLSMEPYLALKNAFEKEQDAAYAAKMAAYMRNLFPFYGLPTPKRKAVCKPFLQDAKKHGRIDWLFLDQCYGDDHREFQYFVIDYLSAMQNRLVWADLTHIETYIRTKQWWDTIDGFDKIVGHLAFCDPRGKEQMLQWSVDPDFWVRRIAIDHQLGRKEQTDTQLLEKILLNNLGSTEFFINKAIGWSLREYSKTNPEWVRDFLKAHRTRMNPLSIREASKYIGK